MFQIRRIHDLQGSDEDEVQIANIDEYDPHEEEEHNEAAAPEEKSKRRKTIKEMLEVIKQWRKLYLQSGSKLNLNEGA